MKKKVLYMTCSIMSVCAYLCIFYLAQKTIEKYLTLGVSIIALITFTFFFLLLYKHIKIKEHLWHKLSSNQKRFLNYNFFRANPALGKNIFLLSLYWKKEAEFQNKRNKIILRIDRKNGISLIKLEQQLQCLQVLSFVSATITYLSFINI